MQIAQALDPVSSIISRDLAVIHFYRRDFDRALDQCDHTVELNPHFAAAYLTLGLVQEQRRDFDESAAAFRRAVDLAPRSPRMHAALARTYALSDRLDQAHEALDALRALAATPLRLALRLRAVHLAMGELDEGCAGWPGPATTAASSCWRSAVDPRFDALRATAEFAATTSRVRLGAAHG